MTLSSRTELAEVASAHPPPVATPLPLDQQAGLIQDLIEGALDAVWLVDAVRLRVVAANPAAGVLLGIAATALRDMDILDLSATPEDQLFWGEVAAGLAERIESRTLVRRFDGSTVPVIRRVSPVQLSPGRRLFMVVLHDLSEQCRIEDELEDRLAELGATLESTADGILVTDLAGNIRSFNRRFAALWGMPEELLTRRDDDAVLAWMRRSVVEPGKYMRRLASIDEATLQQATDTLTLHSGKVIERVTLPQCSRGRPIGRVYSFRDTTEQIEAAKRIDILSHTDSLTGLSNRRVLTQRIEFALSLAQRDGSSFALLLLNVDRFKHINDTLGQAFGDRVLIEVAERLKLCLRQVDTVARLGGDEFVMLVHQADPAGAEATARRVLNALQRPFVLDGLSFTVTASMGIAMHPADGANAEQLVHHADSAMHDMKDNGRGGFRFHRPRYAAAEVDPRSRMKLDHAMRQALASNRFRLHYQPQVDLRSGEVVGAEALIRWRDPELGDVSPGEFIPVAEASGFIVAIGGWVLRNAVAQAAAWHARGLTLVTSVNVSALQFQQADFVEGVAEVIALSGLPPQLLELELTESILIQDAVEALRRLEALAALGVKLAIDDFGTGYSSLSYLKRFPIGRLKIDRSFISGLPADESDAGIVHAIVNMGRALHLSVIAEGVETEAQRQFLAQAGCDQFQGFLCAPALAASEFERRLAAPPAAQPAIRLIRG
jgi:diguanylate cyclase (GGDEF)-like protein/PAS domain S-box-containing protein